MSAGGGRLGGGPRSQLLRLRRRIGSEAARAFFSGAARAGSLVPLARPERHGVEVLRDLPYLHRGSGAAAERREHHLDVYRPIDRGGPLPALVYVHGGGFRILSKDTHWLMGLAFAREGYVVFNVGYRLAPAHPFPAALEDVSAAFAWIAENAERYGADTSRLVVAGESAGANLVTSLTLACAYERPEPFARRIHETGLTPKVALPACGIFQVSDVDRFARRKPHLPRFLRDRLEEVERAYLGSDPSRHGPSLDFADPLCWVERAAEEGLAPARPLPPFFLPVGTKDPILDDTRRLAAALRRLGVAAEDRYYPGEIHAFHAFVFREAARRCWRDTFAFLGRHLPADPSRREAARQ